jgi:hypothetical protein
MCGLGFKSKAEGTTSWHMAHDWMLAVTNAVHGPRRIVFCNTRVAESELTWPSNCKFEPSQLPKTMGLMQNILFYGS